jgi:hypothetical protein
MADMIQCPVCGAENPPGQKNCQRCQSSLSNDSRFQPGQAPGVRDTGELEAILPQWLRDARESAKQPDMGEPSQEETPTPSPKTPAPMDFLAGLQSQAGDNDDEEVPDWLANITGASAPKPKAQPETTETSGVRWVETGSKDDFQQPATSDEEEVPSWLAGIQSPQFGTEEKDELTDWFRESSGDQPSFQPPAQFTPANDVPFSAPASSNDTPDWLKQMAADAGEKEPETPAASPLGASDWFSDASSASNPAPQAKEPEPFDLSSDTPDWLNQMSASANVAPQAKEPEPFDLSSDTPDWLNQMSASANVAPQTKEPEPFDLSSDTPDWLNQMSASVNAAPQAKEPEPFDLSSDTPDWLNQMSASANVDSQAKAPEPFNVSSDAPDWLNSLGGESAPFVESTPAASDPFSVGDIPLWLDSESESSKKDDSTLGWLGSEAETLPPTAQPDFLNNDSLGDVPDWLKAAAPQSLIFDEPPKTSEPLQTETPTQQINAPFEATPAFSEDIFRSEGGDAALFTDMPDWLSNAMEEPPPASMVPEPITGSDALSPNVLPSWVEAMRPSDQSMANIVSASNDLTLESRGALAGLSGVLPMGVGFAPTSKPKTYSNKLNASDEQLKHAEILEQILAAETAPESIAVEKPLVSSRVLRWSLAFILLAVTLGTAILRTQIFSMPEAKPSELDYAVAIVQAIPENAPVLVAVDYEPARAGEMEAAASPLFDHMLLLKHPRLTFVASNESGAMLIERFMAGPLGFHNYESQATYLNLGYLSGGQMGVRAFAQNPSLAAPLDIYSQPAWTFQPLQGVSALNQFAAIILVTDNVDAARSWVEQTQDARGVVPFLVVSSTQAAPMIQPYYDSGQVNGMVSGLYGGALVERHFNSGRPGTARAYWDAYSIGMLLAMMFVLGGGLINLALGLRDRAGTRKGN